MRTYNLYFGNERLNKKPLTIEELEKIKEAKKITKVDLDKRTSKVIPFDQIRINECIVI